MIFQCGLEPFLIHQILPGFEAILERIMNVLVSFISYWYFLVGGNNLLFNQIKSINIQKTFGNFYCTIIFVCLYIASNLSNYRVLSLKVSKHRNSLYLKKKCKYVGREFSSLCLTPVGPNAAGKSVLWLHFVQTDRQIVKWIDISRSILNHIQIQSNQKTKLYFNKTQNVKQNQILKVSC